MNDNVIYTVFTNICTHCTVVYSHHSDRSSETEFAPPKVQTAWNSVPFWQAWKRHFSDKLIKRLENGVRVSLLRRNCSGNYPKNGSSHLFPSLKRKPSVTVFKDRTFQVVPRFHHLVCLMVPKNDLSKLLTSSHFQRVDNPGCLVLSTNVLSKRCPPYF